MSTLLELFEVSRKITKLRHKFASGSFRFAMHARKNCLELLVSLVVEPWSLLTEACISLLFEKNALLVNQFTKQISFFFLAEISFND